MSAYVVEKRLIDGLLTFGIEHARPYGPLRWTDPAFYALAEHEHAYATGQPWGDLDAWRPYLRELTRETAGRVGAVLWAENLASVNHRYDEEELEEPYVYKRFEPAGGLHASQVFAALGCYEYQSCEHPGWRTSEAHAIVEALTALAIRKVPSHGDGMWWMEREGE